MKRLRSILSLALITCILTGLLSGCGTKVTDISTEDNNLEVNSQGTSLENNIIKALTDVSGTETLESGTEALGSSTGELIEKPKVPEPASLYSVQWECGTCYTDISYENLQTFLQKLKDDGWKDIYGSEISEIIKEGISEYMLARGNDLLQIMIFLNDKEESINNRILIRKDKDINIDLVKTLNAAGTDAPENSLTKAEAKNSIQQYVNQAQNSEEFPYASETLEGVFEIFIDGAYDKLEMQAYAAVSDSGYYGCFLIRKGVVSYIGGNLTNTCIVDIDKDGKYEIITLYYVWEGGITKYNLMAYEYINPIYFNSPTEILQVKYYNCFVPTNELRDLSLEKVDDNNVKLLDSNKDYGILIINGVTLEIVPMDKFPYELWATYYDQDILKNIDKVVPTEPPDILVTIDGTGIDYVVKETKWDGAGMGYTATDAFRDITDKGNFIPTFKLSNMIEIEVSKQIIIDFGSSIPDSILIYDSMLNDDGGQRYDERLIQKTTFKITDSSHIQFELKQHMSYFLSSNMADYEKDWYRLFRMVCTWGDNECTYAFLINTGNTEKLSD